MKSHLLYGRQAVIRRKAAACSCKVTAVCSGLLIVYCTTVDLIHSCTGGVLITNTNSLHSSHSIILTTTTVGFLIVIRSYLPQVRIDEMATQMWSFLFFFSFTEHQHSRSLLLGQTPLSPSPSIDQQQAGRQLHSSLLALVSAHLSLVVSVFVSGHWLWQPAIGWPLAMKEDKTRGDAGSQVKGSHFAWQIASPFVLKSQWQLGAEMASVADGDQRLNLPGEASQSSLTSLAGLCACTCWVGFYGVSVMRTVSWLMRYNTSSHIIQLAFYQPSSGTHPCKAAVVQPAPNWNVKVK